MSTRVLCAVAIAVGALSAGAGVADADYIQNQGTYAGDVIKHLQDWGYDVMLNGLGTDVRYLDQFQQRDC